MYKGGICVRCTVGDQLTEAFASPDGRLSEQARRVVDAMTDLRSVFLQTAGAVPYQ